MNNNQKQADLETYCYHCGDYCKDESYCIGDKVFCCVGCKSVFEILNGNNLCDYYKLDDNPGIAPFKNVIKQFEFLDDESVAEKLIDFKNNDFSSVTFEIPQMHCSSCIWLLEQLYKINSAIFFSRVDFLNKQLNLKFDHNKISLKEVVLLLANLGYEPLLNLDSIQEKSKAKSENKIYYKLGLAGFCFGNIMLFSFPEYFSISRNDQIFREFFNYLNFILALPVVFYSASDYFVSAYKGIKEKILNIDFPISLGITALFLKSSFDVFFNSSAGYFDSLSGLVFFLLLGKIFQNKTYNILKFDRDYKSFFPLSVIVLKNSEEISVPVSKLKIGDRIKIRNKEIIPADSILFKGEGNIDYSFVTGEAEAVPKVMGELVYAGGRQIGGAIELEVVKEVSQSYLTRLWNNSDFTEHSGSKLESLSNLAGKYFTYIILFIAVSAYLFWMKEGAEKALNVFTSVLIIACPCALALSVPFTMGNTLRIFGRNKFYLKNISVIELINKITSIVFDKTGTITKSGISQVEFHGKILKPEQACLIKSLVKNSTHPLSKAIYNSLINYDDLELNNFIELEGKGIKGNINGIEIKLGNKLFVEEIFESQPDKKNTQVYISINQEPLGYFTVANKYRNGMKNLMRKLQGKFKLFLLSGDNDGEKIFLKEYFEDENSLLFNQNPIEKLSFIKNLQAKGEKVLMIGDGLNDAGALKRSDVGISVTESINNFSPACDAILDAETLTKLPEFLKMSAASFNLVKISFVISLLYNSIGLTFAVQGFLTPIISAILMPISSISVVLFAILSTNIFAKKYGL